MTRPNLRAISASQIKSFQACPRKWGWDKLAGAPRGPDKPATALGTRVHEILEDWLEHGTPPDPREIFTYQHPREPTEIVTVHPGKIAESGLHHLPAPKTCHVEDELRMKTKAGPYYGRIDVHGLDPDGVPYVLDHKTTSNFRYALTPDTILDDVQALLYAAWTMIHYDAQKCRLRWVYYLTTGKTRRSKKVEAEITRQEIESKLEQIDQTAAVMWEAYKAHLHPADLRPRPSACRDYGGCQYAELCDLSPEQKLRASMTEHSTPAAPRTLQDILDGVTAAPSVPGAPPPPPVPDPEKAPPPPPAPPVVPNQDNAPPAIQGNVHDGGPTPPITVPGVLSKGAPGYGLPPAPRHSPETSQVTPQANINPPEAPAPDKEPPTPRAEKPPAAPVTHPAEDAGRKEVKAYAVQIGAVDKSSRLGLPKLWEAIEAHDPHHMADFWLHRAAETGTGDRHDETPPPPPAAPPADVKIPEAPRAPTLPIAGGALDRDTVADYPNPIQVAGRRLADLWTADSPEDAAKVEAVMDLVVAFLGEVARRG